MAVCCFCTQHTDHPEDQDWIPSFWSSHEETEYEGPVCNRCAKHLTWDQETETYELQTTPPSLAIPLTPHPNLYKG